LADDERPAVMEAYAPRSPGGNVIGAAEPHAIFQVCALAGSGKFLANSQPAINGVADARSLASLYSVIACGSDGGGRRLLGAKLLQSATTVQRTGQDVLTGVTYALGWGLANYYRSGFTQYPMGAVGHPGLGGSAAFADPDARLSFAYVPSVLELPPETEHGRAAGLVAVLYDEMGRGPSLH
jgi:CubicO group peptidase (beta-lactamase class C family)